MGAENFGVLKAATRRFAHNVKEMRDWQRKYFAAPKDSTEKATALAMAKKAEKTVDETLQKIHQVLEKL
ncbi:MAG: hypothetical protein ACR2K1_01530 [Saprospiraceae bacterium]